MPARPASRTSYRCAALITVLALLGWPGRAAANVTSIGSVNPIPPPSGGVQSGTLTVGDDDAASSDIRAWVNLNGGTSLQYSALVIGDEEGFLGEMNVIGDFLAGVNTQLTLTASGLGSNPTVQVGLEGTGRLNVRGATMTLTNSQSNMSIGVDTTGIGYVTISDPFTLFTLSQNLIVGDEGMGRLEVLNGAWVQTTNTGTGNFVTIGSTATSVGTVIVDGFGSVLSPGSNLNVGGLGSGTLVISDQAIVDANNQTGRTITVGTLGRVELDGGTLLGLQTTVHGFLGGGGLVRGPVTFNDTSSMEVGPGDLLRFDGEVNSNGTFTINQGELQFQTTFHNNFYGLQDAPGRITLENGTIRFYEPLLNQGVISSAHGTNNIHGEILNEVYVVVAGDTVATFHDTFLNVGGGVVDILPRGTALFLADLMFDANSLLQLSVGLDEDMLDSSSQLVVAGEATLDGDLTIDMLGNFTPEVGQSFTLLSADGGINGTFDNEFLPDIPGILEFGLLYDANSVRLEVQIEGATVGLAGDYNNDGTIDAADYTVWRDALTAGSGFLLNDPTPGTVDESDFLYWRAHFGETDPFGAGAGAGTVPEPATALLSLAASATLLFSRRHIVRPLK